MLGLIQVIKIGPMKWEVAVLFASKINYCEVVLQTWSLIGYSKTRLQKYDSHELVLFNFQ